MEPETDDIAFVKKVVQLIFLGHVNAIRMIDWCVFKVGPVNFGFKYILMPGKAAKESFCKSAIKSIGKNMQSKGNTSNDLDNALTNWRITCSDSGKTIVEADSIHTGKALEFGISHKNNERKLYSIS